MADETTIGGMRSQFGETRWTVIRRAQEGSAEDIALLLHDYWKPIYFYVRRHGHDIESAKDLTQSFCVAFLEKNFLKSVSADQGRFRAFVMAALKHFLSDQWDRARAVKRGGRYNFVQAEVDLASTDPTPERAFFKGWASAVLERAKARAKDDIPPEDLAMLEGGPSPEGVTPENRKNRVRKARERLRECLREEIQPLVELNSDVDSELNELFASLFE